MTPQPERRRQRRRATAAQGAPPQPAQEKPAQEKPAEAPRRRRPAPRDANTERALRDLVGAGRSQLGVDSALRARDVNRPSADDLAEAERDVVIVRRSWQPSGE